MAKPFYLINTSIHTHSNKNQINSNLIAGFFTPLLLLISLGIAPAIAQLNVRTAPNAKKSYLNE
jgi:hypothetical protein